MSKHSPGPWVYEGRSGDDPRIKEKYHGWGCNGMWDAEDNVIFGTTGGWDREFTEPENPADIKLLQAAPDMLAVLKDILCSYECGDKVDNMIRKVLRKAEGGYEYS